MPCYLISYDLRRSRDYEPLYAAIEAYGTWAHIHESVCFHLADVRFKLLAALPAATLAGLVVLPEHVRRPEQLASGILGVLITIALTIYDQRNTQIYDRLVRRAKWLERRLALRSCEDSSGRGGAFLDRPKRRKVFHRYDVLWHDLALAVVYSSSLAGWSFIALRALFTDSSANNTVVAIAVALIFLTSLSVLIKLACLNDKECAKVNPESTEDSDGGPLASSEG